MIIRYLTIKDLEDEEFQKVWCVFQEIKETLGIRYKSNFISVSLCPEKCKISKAKAYEILKEFQKKGILKILKIGKLNQSLDSVPVRVNKKRFNPAYKEAENRAKGAQRVLISFDKKLCIFKYGNEQYKPQRKGGRCQILKKLWEGRRIIDANENEKKVGQYFGLDELAVEAKFINSVLQFNKTAERSVRDAIQDIRDQLCNMKVPVEIIAQNGFMLILKE